MLKFIPTAWKLTIKVKLLPGQRALNPQNQSTGLGCEGLSKAVQNLRVKCNINLLLVFLELFLPNSGYSLPSPLLLESILPCVYLLKKSLTVSLHQLSFEI